MELNCNHLSDYIFHVSGFCKDDSDVLGAMSLVDAVPYCGLIVQMIRMDMLKVVLDPGVN
jgi:hypothetical protein